MLHSDIGLNQLNHHIKGIVRVAKTGYSYTGTLLCIPVPKWKGWTQLDFTQDQTLDHVARWEFYFTSSIERFTIILRIMWPCLPEVSLKFLYPDDRSLVLQITRHRCIALLDRKPGKSTSFSRSQGILVGNIPSDLPGWFGLSQPLPRETIQ